MTFEELNQLYYLKRIIERNSAKLSELRAQLGTIKSTTDYSKTKVQTSGNNSSNVEALAINIAELVQTIALQNQELIIEQNKLERYISSINDKHVQLIFKLRFIDCMRWEEIAFHAGGNNTAESVRKMCARYIDKSVD